VPTPVPRKSSTTSRRTAGGAVDEVLGLAGAEEPPGDGHLAEARVLGRELVTRIDLEGEGDLGHRQRRLGLAAVEDDVFHPPAAQVLGALLAHDPADGVDDVRLAAAIRTDDAGDSLVEGEHRPVHERLEAGDVEAPDAHGSGGLLGRKACFYRSGEHAGKQCMTMRDRT
jgi:hypothetical protein